MATQRLPPDTLYKYRNLVGPNRGYLEQLLTECTVYFTSPELFNDPFDCRVHVVFPGSPLGYRKYLVGLFKKFRPDLSRQQRRQLADQIVKEKRPQKNQFLQSAITNDVQRDVNALGVFSCCEHPDDILMWSHYADGHKGVCLGFQTSTAMGIPLDVAYADEFPLVDFLNDSKQKQVKANLLTKASRWAYEREWRIVDTNGHGPRRFPPEMLTRIIFGCRTPDDDRSSIRGWTEAGPARPRFYESVVRPRSYSVEIFET